MGMDKYIKRKEAVAVACKGCNKEFPNEPCEPFECYIQQGLFNIPVADVVEVVRCKDCKHYGRIKGLLGLRCDLQGEQIWCKDDFCSYGERREGE